MRGEIKRGRDIDRPGEYPITPDGREERDDVPYKSKLDKIRGSRGLRDTNEERAAVGKMRKIKRDAKYSGRKRLEHTTLSGTESDGDRVDRSRERKRSTARGRRQRGLYRDKLEESERMTGTDRDEKKSGRRRKKPRRDEDTESEEMEDTGERREARRRKKGVSYSQSEEEKVRKRDGKWKGRSEGDETDSDLTKKRGKGRYIW